MIYFQGVIFTQLKQEAISCFVGELCQEKWQKKRGGRYHRKLSAMGLPTEERGGGYHQMVTWKLPEGTRMVVIFQLLICV